jgi:type II secretory pathway pseudopilin PulG
MRHRTGITVLEILVGVVVISTLSAVLIVRYQGAEEKARLASLQADLRSYATAQELRLADQGTFAPHPDSLSGYALSGGVRVVRASASGASQWGLMLEHQKENLSCSLSGGPAAFIEEAQSPVCTTGTGLTFFVSNAHPSPGQTEVVFDATPAIEQLAARSARSGGGAAPPAVSRIEWDFGDGIRTSGPPGTHTVVSHVYAEPEAQLTASLRLVRADGTAESGAKSIHTRPLSGSEGNLVLNGAGGYRSNKNFSRFTFVSEPVGEATGYFRGSASASTNWTSDHLIAVDTLASYSMQVKVRGTQSTGVHRFYLGFVPYDEDGLQIGRDHHSRRADTRLARPLSPGDTILYVDAVSGWTDGEAGGVSERTLVLWNYKSARGYDYGEYTYSRRIWGNAWLPGAIDFASNSIRLRAPLPASLGNPDNPNGTWPVGHAVSNGGPNGPNGGLKYCLASSLTTPQNWTQYSRTISGVDHSGRNSYCSFPPGTIAIRPLFYFGYGDITGIEEFGIADIRLVKLH